MADHPKKPIHQPTEKAIEQLFPPEVVEELRKVANPEKPPDKNKLT